MNENLLTETLQNNQRIIAHHEKLDSSPIKAPDVLSDMERLFINASDGRHINEKYLRAGGIKIGIDYSFLRNDHEYIYRKLDDSIFEYFIVRRKDTGYSNQYQKVFETNDYIEMKRRLDLE